MRWVVPEGYLSDDEGIHDKKKSSSTSKNHSRIVSRPVKWPISANKVIVYIFSTPQHDLIFEYL